MKKTTLVFSVSTLFVSSLLLSSCSGCVKKISKKTTEYAIEAVDGITEVVDEQGERIGEKTTDAAGKVVVGIGRSLEKQLNEHATKVASTTGRTTVQALDGFSDGTNKELDEHYDKLPYTENFASGIALDYFAKYKTAPIVDSYFIIPEVGDYKVTFECYNNQNNVILTKTIDVSSLGQRKYLLVSFALNSTEEEAFKDLKNVNIIVRKK